MSRKHLVSLGGALIVFFYTATASAAPLDVPTVTLVQSSKASLSLEIQAGPSGAPAGFWIDWTTQAEYAAKGWSGYAVYCTFNGTPTLNVDGTTAYTLGPNETAQIEVGDFFDETGMWASDVGELDPSETYVFRIFAMQNGTDGASPYSSDLSFSTMVMDPQNCTYTQGYWKNHTAAWPTASITLGTVSYTASQLLDIFNTPAKGNGLIFLAHQLIAARLNEANGATVPTNLQSAMAQADALIGGLVVPPVGSGSLSPASASSLTETLDEYNNGILGPGHCDAVPAERTSWGALKAREK